MKRYLFTFLMTVAMLALSLMIYVFMCWIFGYRPTFCGYTFVTLVSVMFQFYAETLRRIDEED